MKVLLWLVLAGAFLLSGCASVSITPKQLAAVGTRQSEARDHLQRWEQAVWLCNEFLRSDLRQTLPRGRVRFAEEGMEFVGADFTLPCRIRCTWWGDVLVACKMVAQERSDGFVVGLTKRGGDRLLDNSFFLRRDGQPQSNFDMASLILHELTHSYYKVGTVDFLTGFRYYAESVARFTYRNHSMERLPFRTSAEFRGFAHRFMQQHARPPERPAAADTEEDGPET